MLDLKAFATSIFRKRGKHVRVAESAEVSEVDNLLKPMLTLLREHLEKMEGNEETKARAALSEMILPKVIKVKDGEPTSIPKACREWAFACGHMLGMLAGLAIEADHMNVAVDEIAGYAKATAKDVHNMLEDKHNRILPSKKASTKPAAKEDGNTETKRKMADDLEEQAMLEPDEAAKAALKAMAWRIRKELSLSDDSKIA